jgi:hypothetical protein
MPGRELFIDSDSIARMAPARAGSISTRALLHDGTCLTKPLPLAPLLSTTVSARRSGNSTRRRLALPKGLSGEAMLAMMLDGRFPGDKHRKLEQHKPLRLRRLAPLHVPGDQGFTGRTSILAPKGSAAASSVLGAGLYSARAAASDRPVWAGLPGRFACSASECSGEPTSSRPGFRPR